MSDLQIRGAGNLLGTFQSGHVASVGYDLYLEILKRTIDEMRGRELEEAIEPEVNLKIPAFFPETYVPDVEQRLHLYRELAMARDLYQVETFREELEDRFGALPKEAENLVLLSTIKVYLRSLGVRKLDRRGKEAIFSFDPMVKLPREVLKRLAKKNGYQMRLTRDQRLYLTLSEGEFLDGLLSFLKDLEERRKETHFRSDSREVS